MDKEDSKNPQVVDKTKEAKELTEKKSDTSHKPDGDEAKEKPVDAESSVKKDSFRSGDRIVVSYKITEGKKSRIQLFEGLVIAEKGSGVSRTFTIRRISAGGIGVERIFPLHSPNIASIAVKSKGKVRRAKLYYMREREGRAASKIKER